MQPLHPLRTPWTGRTSHPPMSSNSGQRQIYETGVETEGRVKMGKGFHPTADVTCRAEGNAVLEEGPVVISPFIPAGKGGGGLHFEVVNT